MLVLGGILAAAIALLAGTSGFGFGLLATPTLLLAGFSLPFVVTVNLLISVATRISVAYRLHNSIDVRRVALLVGGAAPGLWIGSRTLAAVDEHAVRVTVGVVIMAAAAALAYVDRHPPREHGAAASATAGFLGGLLGTSTSLIGVPPALMLSRRRAAAASFFADLAVYFIAAGAIGLAVLAVSGHFDGDAAHAFVYWLPGVLVANVAGTSLGLRIPAHTLRWVTLGLAFAAGAVTAATA